MHAIATPETHADRKYLRGAHIHVAAAASPRLVSAPRRGRGVAAIHRRCIRAARVRRHGDHDQGQRRCGERHVRGEDLAWASPRRASRGGDARVARDVSAPRRSSRGGDAAPRDATKTSPRAIRRRPRGSRAELGLVDVIVDPQQTAGPRGGRLGPRRLELVGEHVVHEPLLVARPVRDVEVEVADDDGAPLVEEAEVDVKILEALARRREVVRGPRRVARRAVGLVVERDRGDLRGDRAAEQARSCTSEVLNIRSFGEIRGRPLRVVGYCPDRDCAVRRAEAIAADVRPVHGDAVVGVPEVCGRIRGTSASRHCDSSEKHQRGERASARRTTCASTSSRPCARRRGSRPRSRRHRAVFSNRRA